MDENKNVIDLRNAEPYDTAAHIVKILDDKKARDIKLLHVEENSSLTSYLVLCSGTSNTDAYIRDIMRHHGVETDAKLFSFGTVHVMCTENLIGNGVLTGLILGERSFLGDGSTVQEINSIGIECYHRMIESINIVRASMSAAPPGEIPSAA